MRGICRPRVSGYRRGPEIRPKCRSAARTASVFVMPSSRMILSSAAACSESSGVAGMIAAARAQRAELRARALAFWSDISFSKAFRGRVGGLGLGYFSFGLESEIEARFIPTFS